MKTVDELTDVRLLSYACHFLAANLDEDNLSNLLRLGDDDATPESLYDSLEHRLDDLGDRFRDPVDDSGECHECGCDYQWQGLSNETCPNPECPSNLNGPEQVVVIAKKDLVDLLTLLWAELDADEDSRHLFWTRDQLDRMIALGEHLKTYAF